MIQRTKVKNRSKYTCELYIKNWSYSNKVGIVFAMYQRMRSKGASWAGPRLESAMLKCPIAVIQQPQRGSASKYQELSSRDYCTWCVGSRIGIGWTKPSRLTAESPHKTWCSILIRPHYVLIAGRPRRRSENQSMLGNNFNVILKASTQWYGFMVELSYTLKSIIGSK